MSGTEQQLPTPPCSTRRGDLMGLHERWSRSLRWLCFLFLSSPLSLCINTHVMCWYEKFKTGDFNIPSYYLSLWIIYSRLSRSCTVALYLCHAAHIRPLQIKQQLSGSSGAGVYFSTKHFSYLDQCSVRVHPGWLRRICFVVFPPWPCKMRWQVLCFFSFQFHIQHI